MTKYFLYLLLLFSTVTSLSAQEIEFISTKWSDSFREWEFLDVDEEVIGNMRLKWDIADDFNQWLFEINDLDGEIKTKWRDDPSIWEMNIDGEFLTARPVFPGDFRSWKISYDGQYFTLNHEYGLSWSVKNTNFKVKSYSGYNPRDWVLEGDYGTLDKPLEVFVIFLAIYQSVPKE